MLLCRVSWRHSNCSYLFYLRILCLFTFKLFFSLYFYFSLSPSVCMSVYMSDCLLYVIFFSLFIIPLYTLLKNFLFTFLLRSIFLSPLSLMLFLISLSAPVSPFLFLSFSLFLSFFPFLSFFSFSHSHFTIFSFCLSLSRSLSLSFFHFKIPFFLAS